MRKKKNGNKILKEKNTPVFAWPEITLSAHSPDPPSSARWAKTPPTGPSARAFLSFFSLSGRWRLGPPSGSSPFRRRGSQQAPLLAAGWARAAPPVLRDLCRALDRFGQARPRLGYKNQAPRSLLRTTSPRSSRLPAQVEDRERERTSWMPPLSLWPPLPTLSVRPRVLAWRVRCIRVATVLNPIFGVAPTGSEGQGAPSWRGWSFHSSGQAEGNTITATAPAGATTTSGEMSGATLFPRQCGKHRRDWGIALFKVGKHSLI
jgi:hypothetical protein